VVEQHRDGLAVGVGGRDVQLVIAVQSATATETGEAAVG
jgi:hypothetical protein